MVYTYQVFFALALIVKLIDVLFLLTKNKNNKKNYFYIFLVVLLLMSETIRGICRSIEHSESMNQYSLSIIKFDALFIYGYKNQNIKVSIPKKRYLLKEKHLKELEINDFRWGDDINIKSKKLIISNYGPLSF